MAKENKKSLIIWAVVALVIGVILGLLITNITTTGKAKEILGERAIENIQEDRIDLRLNNLFVNSISNNSTSPNASIALNSHIKSNKGLVWGNYEGQTALLITENTNTANNGNSTITIKAPITIDAPFATYNSAKFGKIGDSEENAAAALNISQIDSITSEIEINAPVKMNNLNSVSPVVQVYDIGDTFTIENKTIEVVAIWDANGVVEMHLSDVNLLNPIVEFYAEGDIIFNEYLNANLKVETINQNYVGIVILPNGDFYVCINSENELYKSNYPCN